MYQLEQKEEESGELHTLQRFGSDLAAERELRFELCWVSLTAGSKSEAAKARVFHRGEFTHRNGSSAEPGWHQLRRDPQHTQVENTHTQTQCARFSCVWAAPPFLLPTGTQTGLSRSTVTQWSMKIPTSGWCASWRRRCRVWKLCCLPRAWERGLKVRLRSSRCLQAHVHFSALDMEILFSLVDFWCCCTRSSTAFENFSTYSLCTLSIYNNTDNNNPHINRTYRSWQEAVPPNVCHPGPAVQNPAFLSRSGSVPAVRRPLRGWRWRHTAGTHSC